MSLTVKNDSTGGDFKLLPPGYHDAICIGIYDFGPQATEYNGERKEQNKVRLQFEVPDERVTWTDKDNIEHEGPMTVGKTYTSSLFEKATLCQHLEGWRGRQFTESEKMGFDLNNVLGKPCTIQVQHKTHKASGNQWADIVGIGPAKKGAPTKAENSLLAFDFDNHTDEELASLPEWMQDKVRDGKELLEEQRKRVANNPQPTMPPAPEAQDFANDDIPF